MAQTAVDICNHALDLIGANAITSLADPVREAQVCSRTLPIARRAFLRDNIYNFSHRFESLTAEDPLPSPNPLPDFPFVFDLDQLTEPWIKIWAVKEDELITASSFNPNGQGLPYLNRWKVADNWLGAERDTIIVEYGIDLPDENATPPADEDYSGWDTAAYDALCGYMAYKLSVTLTQNETLQDRMLREYNRLREVAQNRDGQEGVKDNFRTEGRLIGVRQSRASVWQRW